VVPPVKYFSNSTLNQAVNIGSRAFVKGGAAGATGDVEGSDGGDQKGGNTIALSVLMGKGAPPSDEEDGGEDDEGGGGFEFEDNDDDDDDDGNRKEDIKGSLGWERGERRTTSPKPSGTNNNDVSPKGGGKKGPPTNTTDHSGEEGGGVEMPSTTFDSGAKGSGLFDEARKG